MNTFLVIRFDRYDTEESSHEYVEAETFKEAIIKTHDNGDEEFAEYIDDMMVVKRDFASISEEESDILCYKLRSVK